MAHFAAHRVLPDVRQVLLAAALVAAPIVAAAGPACAVSTAQLVGDWLNVDENAESFEEARFTSDKGEQGFVSFVHHAPFVTGTWTLKDCKVHIAGSGDGTDYDFAVLGLVKGRLSLKDESDGSALVLKKAK